MTLTIFVPGRLTNPLNGSWGHWSKHARIARRWRNSTSMAVYWTKASHPVSYPALGPASTPKAVTLTVHTGGIWDDDGLPAACKPLRDGLRDAGMIDDDTPTSGHRFTYLQRIDRKHRGVTITVERLALAAALVEEKGT